MVGVIVWQWIQSITETVAEGSSLASSSSWRGHASRLLSPINFLPCSHPVWQTNLVGGILRTGEPRSGVLVLLLAVGLGTPDGSASLAVAGVHPEGRQVSVRVRITLELKDIIVLKVKIIAVIMA